jgi:hypothetical protein
LQGAYTVVPQMLMCVNLKLLLNLIIKFFQHKLWKINKTTNEKGKRMEKKNFAKYELLDEIASEMN